MSISIMDAGPPHGHTLHVPRPSRWIRRVVKEPAPELTFVMRGAPIEFLSKGTKFSIIMAGPTELILKIFNIC